MGTGIGIVSASVAKLDTQMICENDSAKDKCRSFIEGWIDKEMKKGRIDAQGKTDLLSRMSFATQISDARNADFVVEAVYESFDLKKYKRVTKEDIHRAGRSLPKARNPGEQHLFDIDHEDSSDHQAPSPSDRDALLQPRPRHEARRDHLRHPNRRSHEDSHRTVLILNDRLSAQMGKEIVHASDVPGFIANRVLMPWINEAVFCLNEGIGSVEDIDKAMKLGTNGIRLLSIVPMGPFTLADFIGLDTCLAIMRVLEEGHGDPKFRPCPLLQKYVDAGWYGKKSGRGFYNYATDAKK